MHAGSWAGSSNTGTHDQWLTFHGPHGKIITENLVLIRDDNEEQNTDIINAGKFGVNGHTTETYRDVPDNKTDVKIDFSMSKMTSENW